MDRARYAGNFLRFVDVVQPRHPDHIYSLYKKWYVDLTHRIAGTPGEALPTQTCQFRPSSSYPSNQGHKRKGSHNKEPDRVEDDYLVHEDDYKVVIEKSPHARKCIDCTLNN